MLSLSYIFKVGEETIYLVSIAQSEKNKLFDFSLSRSIAGDNMTDLRVRLKSTIQNCVGRYPSLIAVWKAVVADIDGLGLLPHFCNMNDSGGSFIINYSPNKELYYNHIYMGYWGKREANGFKGIFGKKEHWFYISYEKEGGYLPSETIKVDNLFDVFVEAKKNYEGINN